MTLYYDIPVPKDKISRYDKLMDARTVDYGKEDIPRYGTVESWTAVFPGGIEVDVKICSSNDGDPLWCEAVLFRDGSEQCCTEVCTKLSGFDLRYGGNTYVVSIVAA